MLVEDIYLAHFKTNFAHENERTPILFFIFFHSQVNHSYDAGDYDAAMRYADIAKWLNAASYFCGLVLIITVLIFTLHPS